MGYLLADPIVGLVITAAILRIVVETSKSVFARLLDEVEPEVLDEVRSVSSGTDRVNEVAEVRVRRLGHGMVGEVNIAVAHDISVEKEHEIAQEVHHSLLHHLRYLSSATIHVDPEGSTGADTTSTATPIKARKISTVTSILTAMNTTLPKPAHQESAKAATPGRMATLTTAVTVIRIRLASLLSHFRSRKPSFEA